MKYHSLGRSDIKVSEIAFGCMSLSGDYSYNEQLIDRAIDNGINFFDTADVYNQGQNETVIGKVLRSKRHDVIIASKVGNVWQADNKAFKWDASAKHIVASIDHTLKRLQTDYLDLYQLHGGTIDDDSEEVINTFEQLKKDGKIRAYGISSIRPNVIKRYLESSLIDTVMMQYSLLDRRPEEEALDLIFEKHISVLARGALAQGLLLGKEPKDYLGHSKLQVATYHDRIVGSGVSPYVISLEFALQHPAITSVVTGIRTQQQLSDALAVTQSNNLDPELINGLKDLIPAFTYSDHR